MKWLNKVTNIFGLIKNQRQIVIGSLGFAFGFILIWFISQYAQIVISESDSNPKHYFLNFPKAQAKLTDYVLLNSDWYGKKIVKQIVGLEGDKLWYDSKRCLRVNEKKIGFLKSKSKDNRKLSPIPSQIIPRGYVFVHSDHESSFDSRYQELGLIPISSLEGKVIPLI